MTIEVTEPRIPGYWADKLVNRESSLNRLHKLLLEDPARFQELNSADKINRLLPINYLQQYLTDVCFPLQKNSDGTRTIVARLEQPLKVALRNKILQTCFGVEFDDLFRLMEFDLNEDGDYMLIPRLEVRTTDWELPNTRRAYFESLKLEADMLCEQEGIAPSPSREGGRLPVQNTPNLEKILYRLLAVTTAETSAKSQLDQYNPQDFDTLGANITTHESLLWFACRAQGQNKPSMRSAVFEALKRVSDGRVHNSEELRKYLEEEEFELAKLQSLQEAQPPISDALSEAYRSFGIDQHSLNDDYILNVFRTYMDSAQSPIVKIKHRQNLLTIGRARDSKPMIEEALALTRDEARNILAQDVSDDVDPTVVIMLANIRVDDLGTNAKPMIAASLRVFSEIYPPYKREYIELAAQLDPEGHSWLLATLDNDANDQEEEVNLNIPPGLYNIRNTCYLNSILQYFNTINPVRDVVLNKDRFRLENTDENRSSRRLGGTGSRLTKGEALLAQAFIDELHNLFTELQASRGKGVTPKQRLAIAALKTAEQLSKPPRSRAQGPDVGPANGSYPAPPPLPARPSPMPPVLSAHNSSTGPTVTVNPVPEHLETASNVSSQTLVNQPDDEDHTYINLSHNATADEEAATTTPSSSQAGLANTSSEKNAIVELRHGLHASSNESKNVVGVDEDAKMEDAPAENDDCVEDNILANLNDISEKGTDQNDVEEVMGNILEHLQAALKPTGTDEATGFQTDLITETFYWTAAKYLREVDVSGKSNTPYRRSIEPSRWITAFPAKGGDIDLYTALDSSFDQEFQEGGFEQFTSIAQASPIVHIYLQRSQSEAGVSGRNNNIVQIPEVLYLDRYMEAAEGTDLFKRRERSWNIKRLLQELENSSASKIEVPSASKNASKIDEPDYEVIDHFTDLTQHRYRLHAVICHGGNLTSGHYWVFIYDFEENLWRRYNDEKVIVEEDSTKVLAELNSSSSPYYIAYVRESDVHELVSVPRRLAALQKLNPSTQDIEMQDVHVEHVEDGDEPPPYTPDLA
ncbi:putative ubiquitin carboxyl-terminal hydrolase protein [Phaeoacremonium minimum UCRPA7]|uniref:ubiquitinyl hydrolase 1 n=1 Tax=Phaeoacremonium minimum (strain UCR-PA7) TaxID=1286976 RepID=R8BRH3_PHAM7|nr:putative ubiquitin carboxyl-terminal hydrolase protein [Phaeoacremonium minimum UCRPA7]EOO01972.1 putative ubiquitin carboxyl-terminal hydrolase protein [Phaeoacremonium minimum UCRPA7]